ncbi:Hypothetical predicted protein [Octopus vulgaris]|uniref:Trichohyalin-like n=1 Tax=Octopus vulgaris TaxID=6645 RepID=A0AA36BRI5_OCTVU|nr:Hypothetical predicted protein [Octopus vulgaris]
MGDTAAGNLYGISETVKILSLYAVVLVLPLLLPRASADSNLREVSVHTRMANANRNPKLLQREYTKHKSLMMTASKWEDKQMDVGSSGNHDSIVEVLGKSPITTFREINGWDISSTQFLEKQVEIMRCEAYTKIPVDLVHKMIERQEVSPQAGYKIIREFRCKTEEFIQNLNKQFQIAKQEVHREITLRNKQGSREEMIKIQKEYEDKEKDLVIQLELKQEHDMYSLNREFDLKKRKGLKDLEEELLNLVREESSLLLEKYEWLKEESERKQAEFQKIIENIATYENAVLEERHQKHQAMFEISVRYNFCSYKFTIYYAQKSLIKRTYKHLAYARIELRTRWIIIKHNEVFTLDKIITDDESDQFCTELHQELRRIKDEFSEKRFAKEKELHAELSLEKKRILEDLENKHNREIADLEAKFKQQNDLECEDVVDGYINNYRQDIQNLERKQQEERKEYTIKVNEKLSQKQKESLEQNEEEKESLEKMNENRIEVIEELLKIQDSMSDENRKKILEEHEMQKMRFEKSLTLNKLRQQSLLEEKLAMKRKQKLDNQEKQQALAAKMCLLEENARAIDSMKTMLMEDMRVNGDAESQKIIEEHTKKQQILQQQSEEKKKKFDEELTKKLEVRKLQRETTLTEKHEKEIRDVLCKAPNKTPAIIKKVVLMNKHILERERFINQMNVQLKQNIEELSQQSDIKIQTDLQKNEVKLILSLLAMNKIKREVIFSAMKIPVELKNLINEIQNSENGSDPPEESARNAHYLLSSILCCFAYSI